MKKIYFLLSVQLVLAISAMSQPAVNNISVFMKYRQDVDSFEVFMRPSVSGGVVTSFPLGSGQVTIVFENAFNVNPAGVTVRSLNGGTWTSQDFAIGTAAPNYKYLTFITNGAPVSNLVDNISIKLFDFRVTAGNCGAKLRPYVNSVDPTDPNGLGGDFSMVLSAGVTDYFSTYNDTEFKTCTQLALLPVNFLGFDAQQAGSDAVLSWSVAGETEKTSHYELERSLNGRDFEKVSRIEKTKTSNGINTYKHVDKNIVSLNTDEVFYRVKQIDIDTRFVYSKIKSVNLNVKATDLSLAPNPAQDYSVLTLNMTREERSTIMILDIYGKTVYQQNTILFKGINRVKLPTVMLAAGNYKVVVKSNNSNTVLKLIKQ